MEGFLDQMTGLSSGHLAAAATWLLLQGCLLPSVPEELVSASLGMLAGQGRISLPLAFAAVLAGLLPANAAMVALGRLGRHPRWRRGRLGRMLASHRVESALAAIRAHGAAVVVVTRFLPLVRGPVYLATGLSGLPIGRFFLLDAAAACVQVPLLLWLGSRLGRDATLEVALLRLGWVAVGLAVVALAVVATRRPSPSH